MGAIHADHCDIREAAWCQDTGMDPHIVSGGLSCHLECFGGVGHERIQCVRTLQEDSMFHAFEQVLSMTGGGAISAETYHCPRVPEAS